MKVKDEKVFEALISISDGDLRRSINTLQTASSFKAKELTESDIFAISGVVPKEIIAKIEKVL